LTAKVISLNIKPGIQRDGTQFDAPVYVDGKWVRFQRGRPRKIGGYRGIFQNASGISRGMIMSSEDGLNYVYSGWSDGLQEWVTDDDDGVGSGPTNISLSNFTADPTNLWQFDIGFDSGGSGNQTLIAHPGLNLLHIDNTLNTPVLIGNFPTGAMSQVGVFTAAGTMVIGPPSVFTIASVNALIAVGQTVTGTGVPASTTVSIVAVGVSTTTVTLSNTVSTSGSLTLTFNNNISVSGGCVMLHPYLFVYGNNGLIKNCSAGNFQDWVSADSNENTVSAGKIVKGLPVRGGTTAPSGLFWSLDSLIRVSYAPTTVGTSTIYWRYDIVTSQSSILSSSSVIEYDGLFFWCGVDRFLMYNGVVSEVANNTNINYFFDNVNYAQRQKVWATKIPRWGEIWWFYPKGDATECTDAIIYNVRDKIWYDAGEALGARRAAGTFSEVFRRPIWAGTETNDSGTYTLWQHETGTNLVNLSQQSAIQSYFETDSIGWVNGGPNQNDAVGMNNYIRLERVEPDFIQSEDMNLYVTGKGYASDVDQVSAAYVFSPTTLKIDLREQRREMRLRFESNVVNGNYECGLNLLSADVGDMRSTGNP
jgi:hypothetical protein